MTWARSTLTGSLGLTKGIQHKDGTRKAKAYLSEPSVAIWLNFSKVFNPDEIRPKIVYLLSREGAGASVNINWEPKLEKYIITENMLVQYYSY